MKDSLSDTPSSALSPETDACSPQSRWQADSAALEVAKAPAPVAYPDALAAMEAQVEAIRLGGPDRLWLLEHPPLYTAGTSAKTADLLAPDRFPVYQAGRGGQYTYHGPGQRVGYVMMDLKRRAAPPGPDIRCFVHDLEEWLIRSIARFGVTAERREGRIGLWVARKDALGRPREDKIAALGIRVRRWVSFHGIALNVNPDLAHFTGIVPCGISQHGVTSLHDLGVNVGMTEVDDVLIDEFRSVFNIKRP